MGVPRVGLSHDSRHDTEDWRVAIEVFEGNSQAGSEFLVGILAQVLQVGGNREICWKSRDFSQEPYELLALVFSMYIAFATLVMLNLVTGVFVEGAQRIAREEKEQELIKSVQKLSSGRQ
ncbi:unnamed protein product, partial [Effrenium voratum]